MTKQNTLFAEGRSHQDLLNSGGSTKVCEIKLLSCKEIKNDRSLQETSTTAIENTFGE